MKKHIERDFMHKLTDDETRAELEGYYGKERGAIECPILYPKDPIVR